MKLRIRIEGGKDSIVNFVYNECTHLQVVAYSFLTKFGLLETKLRCD